MPGHPDWTVLPVPAPAAKALAAKTGADPVTDHFQQLIRTAR